MKELLELIAGQSVSTESPETAERLLVGALSMTMHLAGERRQLFRRSLLEGLLRFVEMHLLADDHLLHLSQYWDSYLGRERTIIAERVRTIVGIEPPPSLVEHLRACLEVQAWKRRERVSVSLELQAKLFSRIGERHPRRELRCEVCGFHFRRDDIGEARFAAVADAELRLAASMDPRRKEDVLKPPVTAGQKVVSLTQLTIDHVVPIAGFGWTEIGNLRLVCQFCNGGKFSYRRPFEPLAPAIAASLLGFPEDRPHSPLRQLVVASALAAADGRCAECGRTRDDAELTVRLRPTGQTHRFWFVPWNLDASCYDCIGQ